MKTAPIEGQGLHSLQPVSRELRLLMALVRAQHSDAVLAAAERIVADGVDWVRFGQLAMRNRVLGLVSRGLNTFFPGAMARSAAVEFDQCVGRARMLGMVLLSTQLGLVERVLKPAGARYAALKGATLSARWYGDPLVRQSSDIDLLVDADGVVEVIQRMLAEGWQIASPFWKNQRLDMFVRFVGVVEMETADGRRVEVHRLIDGSGLVFDPETLLAQSTTIDLAGHQMPVLSVTDEFLTAVFHHSRHRWSCYHWVADLISMTGSSMLTPQQVDAARAHPILGPTVDAALTMGHNIEELVLSGEIDVDKPISPFLSVCLDSVDRGAPPPQPVEAPDPTAMEPDFPEHWQQTARYRARFQMARLKPSLTDLDWLPLPPQLAALHWLTRPVRIALQRVGNIVR